MVGAPVPIRASVCLGSGGGELLDAEGFVRIAKRVMPRRQVEVDQALEGALRAVHARLAR